MTEELAAEIFIENTERLTIEKKNFWGKLPNTEYDALYDEFNKRFPIEQLSEMTLEQYTNTKREDSFCYWVETKTQDIGSIWGGSSYKFGIFKFSGNLKSSVGTMRDNEYAWYSKYGNTRNEVFTNVRDKIIQIAHFAKDGAYSKIDDIDLGDAFKWKIAFLYSGKKLINWFKKEILLEFADFYGKKVKQNSSISELQTILIKERGSENVWDFSRQLQSIYQEIQSQNNTTDTTSESSIRYWIYSPGENAFKWEEFHRNGIMALGWEELGDLRLYASRDEIKEKLKEVYTDSSCVNSSLATWQFANEMKKEM